SQAEERRGRRQESRPHGAHEQSAGESFPGRCSRVSDERAAQEDEEEAPEPHPLPCPPKNEVGERHRTDDSGDSEDDQDELARVVTVRTELERDQIWDVLEE